MTVSGLQLQYANGFEGHSRLTEMALLERPGLLPVRCFCTLQCHYLPSPFPRYYSFSSVTICDIEKPLSFETSFKIIAFVLHLPEYYEAFEQLNDFRHHQ